MLEAARDLAGELSKARAAETPEVVQMREEVVRVRGQALTPQAA